MEEPLDARRSKERSPTFPFISLERALDRARQFYGEEKRGVSPFTRAVRHWNYSESSSGALQTVAALKSYGLMEEAGGSGLARQIKLTALALNILLDQRPDSSERADRLRQAALAPAVAAEIYARWPEGLPSDSTLNHFLVLERRFGEETAVKALKILKENQQFARLEGVIMQSSNPRDGEDQVIDVQAKNPAYSISEVGRSVRPQAPPPTVAQPTERHLVLRHGGVTIAITFSDEPTKETFEYLSKYANFEMGNVPPKEPPKPDGDGG